MKTISENLQQETGKTFTSFQHIYQINKKSSLRRLFLWGLLLLLVILFLPWTQSISANGTTMGLYQEQRPQQVNALIPGRIVRWYIKEGDFVKKGDTLLELADVKDDYLDPDLLDRTATQLEAKKQKASFYAEKVKMTQAQINALEQGMKLKEAALLRKMDQLARKLRSDSADMAAANIDFDIAKEQMDRGTVMLKEGVISMVEFEKRKQTYNKAQAAYFEKTQKTQNARQDIEIAQIDLGAIRQDYYDKVYKARADVAASNSEISVTQADVAKNQNQLSNYTIRKSLRWVVAPQNGQVIQARKAGLNEVVKEGDMIVEIVPDNVRMAASLYVKPMDLVLLHEGQQMRILFDGYPAIVFSGWPDHSYGTFSAKISAIESNRSENGYFKIIVVPDNPTEYWPVALKSGTGVQGFALLNNVPIWYELWRRINGFPPDFYKSSSEGMKEKKKS